jgi:type VI secretion system secreted protein VgrG
VADEDFIARIDSPLSEDLLFHAMHAREEVGRLSEFDVNLLSEKPELVTADILGQNVTIEVGSKENGTRYFNGFVTRFAQGGKYGRYHRYHAKVSPWLWYLTRTADCRIFQDKQVPEILEEVFADLGFADFSLELTSAYPKRTYCVQYRETDFNFVSRLMEEEGLYYFFRHDSKKHTMVITDSYAKHEAAPGYETVDYVAPGTQVRPNYEHISNWDFAREVQSGLFVLDDYDFEMPSVDFVKQRPTPSDYAVKGLEVYDYPGRITPKGSEDKRVLEIRAFESYSRVERARGHSNARGLTSGGLFTLAKFPREDQNREHVILSTSYEVEYGAYEAMGEGEGSTCRCAFTAMPTLNTFRPRRLTPKPFVQGPQTAVVVGPGGDEIFTDKYGRVKVQFHWDRRGKKDESSSCWIRVSTPWAGKGWGAVSLPRIGQEVVVDFLEGDPDQPIITGRVYNAEQMPPYDLPANKTQSGIKTRSSLGGGAANFNEIRFEDKKGSEQLFIHAEKNQDIEVENDETHWVGHDRTKTIDHDETTHVKHDRTETVDNDETITILGNRTETVIKDETITISGNRTISVSKSETATVTMQRTHTVGVNESITVGAGQQVTVGGVQAITVGANQSTSVGGTQANSVGGSRTVKTGGSQATTIAKNLTVSIGKNEECKVGEARTVNIGKDDTLKIGKKLLIDAADAIEIKTGDASILMKKDGTIVIKGKDITVQGSGKINVKASSDIVMKGSKIKQN